MRKKKEIQKKFKGNSKEIQKKFKKFNEFTEISWLTLEYFIEIILYD